MPLQPGLQGGLEPYSRPGTRRPHSGDSRPGAARGATSSQGTEVRDGGLRRHLLTELNPTMDDKRIHNIQLKELVYSDSSEIHGTGLFAVRKIVKGEYIGTYWGPTAKRNGTYVLWVFDPDNEADAVGRSGRNLLRFLNHAKPGNAEFDGFDLYARVAIAPGQEITFNYGSDF